MILAISLWWSKTQSGLKDMATAAGCSYTIKVYSDAAWNNLKKCIKTWNMPASTMKSTAICKLLMVGTRQTAEDTLISTDTIMLLKPSGSS